MPTPHNSRKLEDVPSPAYSDAYGQVDFSHNGFQTRARVADDGRVNININQRTRKLHNLLAPALRGISHLREDSTAYLPHSLRSTPGEVAPLPLNVVIHVVGSRGDVQPFVALGQVLKRNYGHRVRLATHPVFQHFVEENGLEFFSIGGDPAELMAFMVKNPGLMPGYESLRKGDLGKRRKGMYEIVTGCWRSCIEAGDGTSSERPSDGAFNTRKSFDSTLSAGDPGARPFVADAIIANPPSFAHVHCAEKLGIPLHLMFTMPWSPTQTFPHPLVNIKSSNADKPMTNIVTYALMELMIWQGLGDIINRFRKRSLGLEPVSIIWAPGMTARLRIPYTYCWSPALIPKPRDWGPHIDISGFFFLSLASNYTPAADLASFLGVGPPPIYIGFGSIVIDDPVGMTKLIFEAVKRTGHRALVSKGWSKFGTEKVPEDVFMVGNVPHDWLFKHVSCVVHHGGAGTTAAGITFGKPTVIIPFFGDQIFWGSMVARAGAGPRPIPYKELTADKLAAAILEALTPAALLKAEELGAKIRRENGADVAAKSFHRQLHIEACALAPNRTAVWQTKHTGVKLSTYAATVLAIEGLLDFNQLTLYRPREYDTDDKPWDPITGGASALLGTLGSMTMGIADFPAEIFKALRCLATDVAEARATLTSGKLPPESSHASTLEFEPTFADNPVSSLHEHNTPADRTDPPYKIRPLHLIAAGQDFSRMARAALKFPMVFTMGLARGFHNAPLLYGDDTVRQSDKITGLLTGLKAAGKEFGFGFYDGISGLITQPFRGANKDGGAGLLKGLGKGFGGLVLKPAAAVFGLPGYTIRGIYREVRKRQKRYGLDVRTRVAAARKAQGYEEWVDSMPEECRSVVERWHVVNEEVRSGKKTMLERFGTR